VVLDKEQHPIAETLANLGRRSSPRDHRRRRRSRTAISKVPMIRDFGVLLAIGIVVLVVVGIVVPTAALGIREWTKPTPTRKPSLVERIVVKLGGLPTKLGPARGAGIAVVFVAGVLVEGRFKIESDPIKWIDQDRQVVKDIERLEEETGFSSTLGILVAANNVYDQDVVDLIWDFTLDAEERPRSCRRRRWSTRWARSSGSTARHRSRRRPRTSPHRSSRCPTTSPRAPRRSTTRRRRRSTCAWHRRASRSAPSSSRSSRPTCRRASTPSTCPPTASCSSTSPKPGPGPGDAGRTRRRRHRPAREPLGEPGEPHLPGARPRRTVAGAPVPQPQPGAAGAGAGVVGRRCVVARRRPARVHAQPAHDGVSGPARDRDLCRVLRADPGALPRGATARSRPARPPPTRRRVAPDGRSSRRRSRRSAASPC
jgi:hypothetical protein